MSKNFKINNEDEYKNPVNSEISRPESYFDKMKSKFKARGKAIIISLIKSRIFVSFNGVLLEYIQEYD